MYEQSNVESLIIAGTVKTNLPLLFVAVPMKVFMIPTEAKGSGSFVFESVTIPSTMILWPDTTPI
jgi:hypothetical protein